ncbi:F5/8 type C domain-containing protein [Rubritalea squalenifaciens DSM 18772]|uniref:F5/8 type C domain-containing protein n=1 Tax=Rubritalea squalenifaciens DSM 18772 TaxID=1123071 RepID=A0A1M6QDF6_9BACT|nr:discoidin domain-containing protein [Rubritalea squalenifaciens]SHK18205.1 F5/8 type C domain-containing protein [Rubritalea squalenifaciens DSM 18772]
MRTTFQKNGLRALGGSIVLFTSIAVMAEEVKWPPVKSASIQLSKKGEAQKAAAGKELWEASQAHMVAKGSAQGLLLLEPGGKITRELPVDVASESYLWLSTEIRGVVGKGDKPGSVILSVSEAGQREVLTWRTESVTQTAQKSESIGIRAQAPYPHNRRVADLAVDGNRGSEWVSVYPSDWQKELAVEIELDSAEMIGGLAYLPRQGSLSYGQIYSYEIQVRPSANDPFVTVAKGDWDETKKEKLAQFDKEVLAKTIRLVGHKTKSNAKPGQKAQIVLSASEIRPLYAGEQKEKAKSQLLKSVLGAEDISRLQGKKVSVEIQNVGSVPILLGKLSHGLQPLDLPKRKYKPRHSQFIDLNAIGLVCRTCPAEQWPVSQVFSITEGQPSSKSELKLGDLIVGVGGEDLQAPVLNATRYPLAEEWMKRHHEAVIARHYFKALQGGGVLSFEVIDPRSGQRTEKVVKLDHVSGSDYQGFPLAGAAADQLYQDLIDRIVRDQKPDGSWGTMPANSDEMYGILALLGTKDPQHRERIYKAVDYLLKHEKPSAHSKYLGLWGTAFQTIALGEYALATGDPRAVAWLDQICTGITQGGHVNKNYYFTYGHDLRVLPYGSGGLIAPLSHFVVGDALAVRLGVKSRAWDYAGPYIKAAWAGKRPYGQQAIGYGAPSSGAGADQAWCRSGLIGVAATIYDVEPEMRKGIAGFMRNQYGFMRRSHGYGNIGCYLGLMGLAGTDKEAFEEVMEAIAPIIAMQWRRGQGLLHVEPQITNVACATGKGSEDAYSYAMAVVLSIRNQGLHVTGGKEVNWMPYPKGTKPPAPQLIWKEGGVDVASASMFNFVTAVHTTDGTQPTATSPEWKPGMLVESETLTVAYKTKEGVVGNASTITSDAGDSPARWKVVEADLGFPKEIVGLDSDAFSLERAQYAFDGNPTTAMRSNTSNTNKGQKLWTVTVDRRGAAAGKRSGILSITFPRAQKERKTVDDSVKHVWIETSQNGTTWTTVFRGEVPEDRKIVPGGQLKSRYMRFHLSSYGGNLIMPDPVFKFAK